MPAGLVQAFRIVMQPPFPVDVVQMPFGHDHELVEAFLPQALDESFDVRSQVGFAYRSQPCFPATGRALATVVNPGEARCRDNREFRTRSARKADAGMAKVRRAAGRDGDFETRGDSRSGCQNWR